MPRNVTLTQFKKFEMLIFSVILCESSKLRIRLVREFSREIDLTNTYFLHMNAMVPVSYTHLTLPTIYSV